MRQMCCTGRALAMQVNDGARYMQIVVADAPNSFFDPSCVVSLNVHNPVKRVCVVSERA